MFLEGCRLGFEAMLSDSISFSAIGVIGEEEEIKVEFGPDLKLGRVTIANRELCDASPAVGSNTPVSSSPPRGRLTWKPSPDH